MCIFHQRNATEKSCLMIYVLDIQDYAQKKLFSEWAVYQKDLVVDVVVIITQEVVKAIGDFYLV